MSSRHKLSSQSFALSFYLCIFFFKHKAFRQIKMEVFSLSLFPSLYLLHRNTHKASLSPIKTKASYSPSNRLGQMGRGPLSRPHWISLSLSCPYKRGSPDVKAEDGRGLGEEGGWWLCYPTAWYVLADISASSLAEWGGPGFSFYI